MWNNRFAGQVEEQMQAKNSLNRLCNGVGDMDTGVLSELLLWVRCESCPCTHIVEKMIISDFVS